MELIEIMRHRRSVRKYTGEKLTEDQLNNITEAALLSASGRAIRPWELIVVQDKTTLKTLGGCREGNMDPMFENASAAFVVIADASKSDTWVEDCSIVMTNMHLMADSIGLGSCWIQGRSRISKEGTSTGDFVRKILGYPDDFRLAAILLVGTIDEHPGESGKVSELQGKIHMEVY